MQAEAIYQVILDLKEEGHLAKRQLNLDLVIFTLMGRYELDNTDYARYLIAARAKILTDMMAKSKTSTFDWSRKAIFRELKSMARRTHSQNGIVLTPLRPRASEGDDHGSDLSSSEEESGQERNAKRRRHRGQTSVLRPKSSVASKQFGKRTQARTPVTTTTQPSSSSSDESDDDDDRAAAIKIAAATETPSKPRGQEFASTKTKRKTHSDTDNDETIIPHPRVTSLRKNLEIRQSSPVSNGNGNSNGHSHSHDQPGMNTNVNDPSPDTWVCQVEGCDKVIYKSRSKESIIAIRDHSLAHEQADSDMQMKLDLVFSEQSLSDNLPVNNLIGRIRQFGNPVF